MQKCALWACPGFGFYSVGRRWAGNPKNWCWCWRCWPKTWLGSHPDIGASVALPIMVPRISVTSSVTVSSAFVPEFWWNTTSANRFLQKLTFDIKCHQLTLTCEVFVWNFFFVRVKCFSFDKKKKKKVVHPVSCPSGPLCQIWRHSPKVTVKKWVDKKRGRQKPDNKTPLVTVLSLLKPLFTSFQFSLTLNRFHYNLYFKSSSEVKQKKFYF